jgi:hypothetical protein
MGVKLDVPAERRHFCGKALELGQRRAVAAHRIEPHPTRALRMHLLELGVIDALVDDHDGARMIAAEQFDRIQGAAVVGAEGRGLHDHHAANADGARHRLIGRHGGFRRRIGTARAQRVTIVRPVDVEVTIG